MIKKADFEQLEAQIDPYVKQKQLKSSEAQHYLDQYLELILSFFKMINKIDEIDFDHLDDYPVVPMNFKERYDYIQMRKYHFKVFDVRLSTIVIFEPGVRISLS